MIKEPILVVDNAIDACIDSSAPIEHRIDFIVQANADTVLFVIQDTGGCMTPKKADTLFGLFYSTKGRSGTGIGLNVTRKIIQKHGGTISVHSDPGQGIRFEMMLPKEPVGV